MWEELAQTIPTDMFYLYYIVWVFMYGEAPIEERTVPVKSVTKTKYPAYPEPEKGPFNEILE